MHLNFLHHLMLSVIIENIRLYNNCVMQKVFCLIFIYVEESKLYKKDPSNSN
jgi:hypothetical protein